MPAKTTPNVRLKRRYLDYLKEAEGKDEKSLDKVAADLSQLEAAIGQKDVKRFHREWGRKLKSHLEKARNKRTGKPLSPSTIDATLSNVKAFIKWLAGQPGYKSRVSYSDAAYFNNSKKGARIAHTSRPAPYPSMEQALHTFTAMSEGDRFQMRDKALFALLMLTGVRVGAAATLQLRHVNLEAGHILQDAREVATKNGKTIDTWFFPVDATYREFFDRWINHLREVELFGDCDPLLPKAAIGLVDGQFVATGFAREGYSGTAKLKEIIGDSFSAAHLPRFTPHAFRKTLALFGDVVCSTLEERKAWSMNLGHEHLTTMANNYMPVSRERQGELIRKLSGVGKNKS
ncbi:MAG: site-specific integrase [Pseudomonadota bacterium]